VAELNARRISVAFGDAQAMWRAHVAAELGRAYRPARLELFTRGTQSTCAPGLTTAGPFYCAAEASVAFDLLFSEALSLRLRRDAELGVSLLVARLAGAHAQAQLGQAAAPAGLTADCLSGVWAHRRGQPLGMIRDGFYGRLIQIARNTSVDLARIAAPIAPGLDPLREGSIAEREAAFQAGFRTGEPAICSLAGNLQARR
jgi:uncharacterized protein